MCDHHHFSITPSLFISAFLLSSHLSHGSLLSAAAVFCLGQTGNVCCLKLHNCSTITATAPAPAAANVDHHLHRTGHSLGGLPPPPHVLPGRAAAPEPAESTSESAAASAVSPTVQWRWRPWCEPCKSAADEQFCGVDGRRTAAAATSAAAPTAASASNQHSADLSADSSSLQH